MAIMRVTVEGTYYNQQTINSFYYVSTGAPAAVSLSFALSDAMGATGVNTPYFGLGTVMGDWQELVSASFEFTSFTAEDMYSDTDFYGGGFIAGTVGAKTGQPMPPMSAFGFRTSRARRSIQRGTKRFCGMDESCTDGGGQIEATCLLQMDALAASMGAVLSYDDEGNTISFAPVILGREAYVVESSGNTAYRFYETEAEQLMHIAQGFAWEPYTTVRSQNSRQYGRGI